VGDGNVGHLHHRLAGVSHRCRLPAQRVLGANGGDAQRAPTPAVGLDAPAQPLLFQAVEGHHQVRKETHGLGIEGQAKGQRLAGGVGELGFVERRLDGVGAGGIGAEAVIRGQCADQGAHRAHLPNGATRTIAAAGALGAESVAQRVVDGAPQGAPLVLVQHDRGGHLGLDYQAVGGKVLHGALILSRRPELGEAP